MELILLASASPRRRRLLEQAGLPFRVIDPEADETTNLPADVDERVRQLAQRKVDAVRAKTDRFNWIVGCDTLVEINGHIMGKPTDNTDAAVMLTKLSGNTHKVHTGIALHHKDQTTTQSAITEVHFRTLTQQEIDRYIATAEWKGAAGAYRIQERGETLVQGINGSYSNVVGLPLSLLCGMLSANRYPFP